MSEWQPIETFPKDGRAVIVSDRGGLMRIGYWYIYGPHSDKKATIRYDGTAKAWHDYAPTHWMPLPEPPK